MSGLFTNVRTVVLLLGFFFSLFLAFLVEVTIQSQTLQTIRLTQYYALTALCLLYITLLAGPLTYTFRSLPFRGPYLKGRRALGVLTFYFSLLHVYFAFFKQLGGFEGLGFLTGKFLLAIGLSATALCILMLLAMTSFDALVARLTFPKWKMLHRFVYLAGILILIHALMLGTHFADITDFVPQSVFLGLALLGLLESLRIDAALRKRFLLLPHFGITTVLITSLAIAGFVLLFIPRENGISLGIHAQHIQIAKDVQNSGNSTTPQIPGMKGDRTKRYSVSLAASDNPKPNQPVNLTFSIFDAASGNPTVFFSKVYDKFLHLIVVDSTLTYFKHIHPDQIGNTFTVMHQFPKDDSYHLYADFQPFGAIEQQMAFTLDVGDSGTQHTTPIISYDTTKVFGNYEVAMNYPRPLVASKMSVGEQKITFTLKDRATQKPIRTLKPYLAAFGHLVMLRMETFEYIHVHPTDLTPPKPGQNGGPDVEFLPLGLYSPIKPGVYRVFAEFNPNNEYLQTDFTVKIE